MAIIFSEGVVEIAVQHLISGRTSVNVWHLRTDPFDSTDPASMALDFMNNWQDHIIPVLTDNVTLQGAAWRSLDRSTGISGFQLPDGDKPDVGEQTGTPLPPSCAFLIRKQIDARGRGQRNGRAYIAGCQEASVSGDGTVTGDIIGIWADALDDFYSGVTTSGFSDQEIVTLVIPKAAREPGDEEFDVDSNVVSRLELDPKIGTQRKRLR